MEDEKEQLHKRIDRMQKKVWNEEIEVIRSQPFVTFY